MNPTSAAAGADASSTADVPLTLRIFFENSNSDPNPTVNFNGQPYPASVPDPSQPQTYLATIPGAAIFNALPSGGSITAVPVFITSTLNSAPSTNEPFTVYTANVAAFQTSSGSAGFDPSVYANGPSGSVYAQLQTTEADLYSSPVVVTVAAYSSSPTTPPQLPGNAYFDLQVSGASAGDSVTLTFTWYGSCTPTPALYCWDATANSGLGGYVLVVDGITGKPPQFICGPPPAFTGFMATFDLYSFPTIFGLTGTILAAAPAPLVSSPSVLWPPDRTMVPVTVNAPSGSTINTITPVSSSEPESAQGDWVITGPLSVDLRADRAGKGPGRVYTIFIQMSDGSQNVALVRVPHDKGH